MQHPFKHPLATHHSMEVLGFRRNGSPIYAIAGGNGEGEGGSGSGANSGGEGGAGAGDQGAGGSDSQGSGQGAQGAGASGAGSGEGDATDWKAHSREWERRAKANANAAIELEKLRAANMSEQEKAVKAAKDEGRTAALAEATPQIAQARLEVAAARAGVDLSEFAEYIDVAKFIGEDGQVDNKAIKAAVTKFSKLAPKGAGRSGADLGGAGGSGDQTASLDKAIEEATKARNFPEAIRLKRLKAAQTQ
ncbi:hypothetical protein ACFWFF_01555 [Streptomyces sp. NPDC060223]|uniref:hypothetical protein n=1 Tax=unclassified Streptomyces TaxID=2593676 RepID=UPI0036447412